MEDSARNGLREFNLASRKAEEAGQSFSKFSFTFFFLSVWLLRKKEKKRKLKNWKESDGKFEFF